MFQCFNFLLGSFFVVVRCKSCGSEDGSLLQRITKAVFVLQKLGKKNQREHS